MLHSRLQIARPRAWNVWFLHQVHSSVRTNLSSVWVNKCFLQTAGGTPRSITTEAQVRDPGQSATELHDTMASGKLAAGSTAKLTGNQDRKPKGKLNPNKSPPVPDHLKSSIGEIEECETPVLPEHYIIVGDLRYVLPYHFDFRLHAKKRMVGVPLVDLFSSEFPVRPRSYYEAALADGRLRVEGDLDDNGGLRPGQCCRHFVHRHEPPVPAAPVEVLEVTDGIVAVNKPACMPVHVTGQYRKNTVVGLLSALRPELGPLAPAHRLDKPVSGVLLLTRTAAAAEGVRAKITQHAVSKEYVARVQGTFPYPKVTVKSPLLWDHRANKGSALGQPPQPPCAAEAAAHVTVEHAGPTPEAAKTAETEFRLMRVDAASGTSLVRCCPKTGRSHQLRIHLAHLGFPIANDRLYGGGMGPPRPAFMLRRPGECAEERRTAAIDRCASAPGTAAVGDVGNGAVAGGAGAAAAVELRDAHGDGCAGGTAAGASTGADSRAGKRERSGDGTGGEGVHVSGAEGAAPVGAADAGRVDADADAHPQSKALRVSPPEAAAEACGGSSAAGSGSVATATRADGGDEGLVRMLDAGSAAAEAAWGSRADAHAAPELVPEARRDALCAHCPQMCPRDYPLDLQPLWLHAESYTSDAWAFRAPLPSWAAADYAIQTTAEPGRPA
eukprot:jgi/Ulvmu1/11018/UM007_0198.1